MSDVHNIDDSNVDQYKLTHELPNQWALRKEFILKHANKDIALDRLICLSNIFVNIETMNLEYDEEITRYVKELGLDVSELKKYKQNLEQATSLSEDPEELHRKVRTQRPQQHEHRQRPHQQHQQQQQNHYRQPPYQQRQFETRLPYQQQQYQNRQPQRQQQPYQQLPYQPQMYQQWQPPYQQQPHHRPRHSQYQQRQHYNQNQTNQHQSRNYNYQNFNNPDPHHGRS